MSENVFLQSPIKKLALEWEKEGAALPKLEAPDSRSPSSLSNLLPPKDYAPLFAAAARKYNVPVNVLMAIGHQESRYNPTAIGQPTEWGRAKGMMQYLDSTAAGIGINPLDPAQAIDAAARQYRERLDKGYTPEEAAKAHFAGDNRELWGAKTDAYGREIMDKAGLIGSALTGAEWEGAIDASSVGGSEQLDGAGPQEAARLQQQEQQATQVEEPEAEKYSGPQMTSWEPTIWDRIKVLLSPNKDAAFVEWQMRESAKEQGITVEEAYKKAGGQRPIYNPEGRAPIQAGLEAAAVVVNQAPDILPALANTVLRTVRGGDIEADPGLIDRWIEKTDIAPDPNADPNYEAFQGIGESLAYSLLTLASSALGGAIGSIGGPVGAGAGAMTAGGTVAYRASKDQFLGRVKEKMDEASKEIHGRPLSEEEWNAARVEFDAAATKYGAWEAVPEAISNLIFVKALSAPLRGANQSMLRRAAHRAAHTVAQGLPSEYVTETATGVGQNRAELEAGLTKEELTVTDAFRRQLVPTTLVTLGLGGGGSIAREGYDAVERRVAPGRAFARELEKSIDETSFADNAQQIAIDRLSPGNAPLPDMVPVDVSATNVLPEAQGPVGRALKDAIEKNPQLMAERQALADEAAGTRVTVKTRTGEIVGTVEEVSQDGNMRVLSDEGMIYEFSPRDGVEILPAPADKAEEPADVPVRDGRLSGVEAAAPVGTDPQAGREAVEEPAFDGRREDSAAPDQQRREAIPDASDASHSEPSLKVDPEAARVRQLDQMSDEELRERMKYIARQAKTNGWSKTLLDERRAVERVINSRAESAANEAEPAQEAASQEPIKWFGSREKAQAWIDKQKSGAFDIVEDGRRFNIVARTSPETQSEAAAGLVFKNNGSPFKTREQAERAARNRRLNGYQPVEVDGGFALSPVSQAANSAPSIEGEAIDREWVRFSPESGTIGIPRAEMPQIKAEHRGAMVNFMNARGIAHREETVPAASLKPTQAEFSRDKVAKAKDFEGGDRSILVSADNHVLDGHHQWLAKRESGEDVKVIRLDSSIRELIDAAHEFPSSTQDAGTDSAVAKSNAPEHRAVGVDDRELSQIVREFNDAHESMQQGDEQIHHLFDHPTKKEIVRLQDKAKVYHREHGWMTPAEAKAVIQEWKDHAAAQGKTRKNADKIVLSLFDYTGAWSQPWEDAGYQVFRFDIQNDPQVGDVNNFSTEFFSDWFGDFDGQDIYAILAACPCTDFASSGARHFAAKDKDGRTVASVKLVHQTLATIEHFRPAVWAIENPVGRIEKLGGLPPWRLSFDPNHLGDPYTKKTLLWGRFNGDLPIAPVEPTEGSKMHSKYGGSSLATKNARSATPEGFAYGFFMANNAIDHPAMAVANKFDRLDRRLIERAIDAGVTPDQIETAVEDHYYMDLDDAAAEQAIRDLMESETTESAEPSVAETGSITESAAREDEPAADPSALFANNKIFTADAVERARARLRAKLGQINSGIDPEVLVDGMTIAGGYIEAGVRNFRDFANRMAADFGDKIKPYLLSFWEAARNYPGVDTDGMSSVEESARVHGEIMSAGVPASEAQSVGEVAEKPKKRTRKTGKARDRVLTQDWGVDHIDGYSDSPNREVGNEVKDAFLKEARSYLNAVSDELRSRGYEPSLRKPVNVNQSGASVSGDVSLALRDPSGGNVYVTIGGTSLRGVVPTTQSGISVMFRRSDAEGDTYATKGSNRWAPVDLSAADLANMIDNEVRGSLATTAPKISETRNEQNQPNVEGRDRSRGKTSAGRRKPDAQSGAAQENFSFMEDGQPENVEAAATGTDGRDAGIRPATTDVGRERQAGARGVSSDGRAGDSGTQSPDAGTRVGSGRSDSGGNREDRGQIAGERASSPVNPETVSPAHPNAGNFHIENPLEIVGGGQVARFNKNKAAIELFNELRDAGRPATREEQAILAGYTGWGSFGQELFQGTWDRPQPKDGWKERDAWLRDHLGQAEWEGMQRSITNAHYTDPPTVLAMWEMMRRMGFQGGRVLEPSMGIGNFFGMMPQDIKARSQLSGIELDPMTGGLAQLIYPDANIKIMGYQDSKTPDNFYDVVIGNWPFEDTVIADRRYNRLSPYLHDYFFLKALDQVRPGGIVMGITSKGTMDKMSANIRTALAKKAELVASYRLPSGAFEEYAGTKVVTDIIILRKRAEPKELVADEGWIKSVPFKTPQGESVNINEYYVANPQNVIGRIEFGHGTTFRRPGMIVTRPDNMADELKRIVNMTPEGAYQVDSRAEQISYIANHTADREGSLVRQNDGFYIVRGEHLAPAAQVMKYELKDPAKTADREAQFGKLIDMRRTYGELIEAERGTKAVDPEPIRKQLRKQYDEFVKAHGRLNDSYGLTYLKKIDDPFRPALAALETSRDGKFYPATILERSTIRAPKRIDNPSITDAFVLARNQSINPSIEQVAAIAGKPAEQVKAELISKGAVFELPNGDIVPSDLYLSGNVREKLKQAQDAVELGNKAMERNVEALRAVVPADVPYFRIEVQLGASWVPQKAYADYIGYMLGLDSAQGIEVTYRAGRWKAKIPQQHLNRPEASTGFGTSQYRFGKLVNAALSNQAVTIRRKDSDGNEYVDVEATQEVNNKISEIRGRFGEWLWSDPERRVEIEREYNDSRNAYAEPKFDGSFLSFEGMALTLGNGPFDLRQHQVNAIWRAIVTRKSLNAHEVGTGKTFTMGGIAVESRRYGLAKKPMILAHNANSKSVAAEIQQMYPAAKVLYIDNLSRDQIAIRLRQIANDDWDAVVVPHSLLSSFAFREETLMAMAQEEIAALEDEALEAAQEDGAKLTREDMDSEDALKKLRSPTAKDLVKQRNRIIESIKKQAQRASKEGAVPFEELGIDMLLVDEAHEFKKPPISTRMRMKGLNTGTSDRSIALYYMARYLRAQNNGGNIHLFTGTPITNTLTEIYHHMRYIMGEEMADAGVDYWDGWFGSFATEVMDVELNAAGEYESVNRLAGFINVPELRRMIGQYMDVVFADDMPEMQPRKTKSGKTLASADLTDAERNELLNGRTENAKDRPYKKVINETADLTPEQAAAFREIQGYAASWRNMSGKERREAMISGAPESPIIYENLAAKASFDVRLMRAEQLAGQEGKVPDDPNSKASRVIRNVLDIYRSDDRATQVIFTQQGLGKTATRSVGPVGGKTQETYRVFSTIHDMIERMVQQGIPREQIALVDGSTSKDKRKEIADKMNRSEIRVVIGSTQSLGVGVNMQRNLRAMHHMDAPWMPGDLEQRNGRGHRQGNQWNTVLEYRYLTDRIDGRRWQVLAIKQRFINSFLQADDNQRVIEGDAAAEEETDILQSFAEAAGDPRILIRTKLQKKLEQVRNRERLHGQGIADAKRMARRLAAERKDLMDRVSAIESNGVEQKVSAAIKKNAGANFSVVIDGHTFNERKDAVEAIDRFIANGVREGDSNVPIGSYAGHQLTVTWPRFRQQPYMEVSIGGERIGGNRANFLSLEAALRAFNGEVEQMRREITEKGASIERANKVAEEPFHQADQLKALEEQLSDLENDLQVNPVAPPAWLRVGAPMESVVYWKGKPFEVTGHRWTNDGWYVLARDDNGAAVIPYQEAADEQGMPLYDTREFEAPEVISKSSESDGNDGTRHSVADIFSMSEDAFIAAVNPTGKRISEDDRMRVNLGDLTVPENAEAVGTFRDSDGKSVSVVRDADGNYYAKQGDDVLAMMGPTQEGETVIDVVEEAQGRGIGTGLTAAYIRQNPLAQSGGFTDAGERTYRAAFRRVRDEMSRNSVGEGGSLTIDDVANELERGPLGSVIRDLIQRNRVVLHDTVRPIFPNAPVGAQAATDSSGIIHLFADGLTPDTVTPVLLHEAFHGTVKPLIGSDRWNALNKRLGAIYRQAKRSDGRMNRFWREAMARIESAERSGDKISEARRIEEFGAYAIEQYESAPTSIRKWVDDLIAAIKNWLLSKFDIQAGAVTPAQLRALAVESLRDAARPAIITSPRAIGGSALNSHVLSVADPVNTPAFKRWFGNSKVVDAEGKPLVVYHGTKADFSVFSEMTFGDGVGGLARDGFFFTSDPSEASDYASGTAPGGNVMPVYLSIQKPAEFTYAEHGIDDIIDADQKVAEMLGRARSLLARVRGVDGLILRGIGGTDRDLYVAFKPEQIKSAIGNAGTFDPANPDIRYSVSEKQAALAAAEKGIKASRKSGSRDFDGGVIRDLGRVANWVQHPYTIASMHEEFTPVFNTAQRQAQMRDEIIADFYQEYRQYRDLQDASRANVNKVLELGRLLQRNYSTESLKNGVINPGTKTVVSYTEDGKPIRKNVPIHAALTTPGEVIRLTGEEREAYLGLRKLFNRALDRFADQILVDMGLSEFVGAEVRSEAIMDSLSDDLSESRASFLRKAAETMSEIEQSKRTGYVPLSRYGRYAITVKEEVASLKWAKNPDGGWIVRGVPEDRSSFMEDIGAQWNEIEGGWQVDGNQRNAVRDEFTRTVYSEKVDLGTIDKLLDERRAEAKGDPILSIRKVREAKERIEKEWVAGNPDRRITVIDTNRKQPKGQVRLSDIDALADLAMIDQDTWSQVRDQFADAVKGRGFRKHFFQSDNVPGYSTDFERAIGDYIGGMAGHLSRRAHEREWEDAIGRIKGKRLHQYAVEYRDYVNSPVEEYAMMRQVGFLMYIAGNMSTAAINATQTHLMAVPAMAQFAPVHLVNVEVSRAYRDALKMTSLIDKGLEMFDPNDAPADVRAVIKEAWDEGAFAPRFTHEVMGNAGESASKGRARFDKTVEYVASTFTYVERLNRLVTFIAAARLANKPAVQKRAAEVLKKNALARHTVLGDRWSPKSFAEFIVNESQFLMGKANRARMLRSHGSLMFQFFSFVSQALQAWYRWSKLQGTSGKMMTAASIAAIVVLSGLWGLPGLDHMRAVYEAAYLAITGEDEDLRTKLRAWVYEVGDSVWLSEVVSKGAFYPMGVDVSSRIGFQSILPDVSSVTDILGVQADLWLERPKRAWNKYQQGKEWEGMAELLPNFAKNPVIAYSWATDGVANSSGKTIMTPEQVPASAAWLKAFGVQPAIVTDVRDYLYAQYREQTKRDKVKSRFMLRLAQAEAAALRNEDPAKRKELEDRIDAVWAEIDAYNDALGENEAPIEISGRSLNSQIDRILYGIEEQFGRERKDSRDAAERLREIFRIEERLGTR